MEHAIEQKDAYAIGIVGATGMVGEKIMSKLVERGFPVDYENSQLFASPRSVGKELEWDNHTYELQYAETSEDYEGLDIVFLSAGGDATKSKVSKEQCPEVAKAGAIAIDNSSAWRMDPKVPLVVAEVNPEALDSIPKGIVANPNCTTMEAMPVLKVLHDMASLKKVVMSSYQAVSGQGEAGTRELLAQTERLAGMADHIVRKGLRPYDPDYPEPEVFPKPVAFNVTPMAGSFLNRDTTEELKFKNESRKILGLANLAIDATCVRVPVLNGHSLSIDAEFETEITPETAEYKLFSAPGVRLGRAPQPIDASGRDDVIVGRIRASEVFDNGLNMFISGDNLLKGAALNAVQIAELLIKK
ncbi:MAG TPA: aspartate-semialdehyde dehydrogenase [Candidatus Saccharimonadales bacterium]|nr:aspartate-semialdehyde dehydrogenase [Candidatus Saccharimonadales bacterium]